MSKLTIWLIVVGCAMMALSLTMFVTGHPTDGGGGVFLIGLGIVVGVALGTVL